MPLMSSASAALLTICDALMRTQPAASSLTSHTPSGQPMDTPSSGTAVKYSARPPLLKLRIRCCVSQAMVTANRAWMLSATASEITMFTRNQRHQRTGSAQSP